MNYNLTVTRSAQKQLARISNPYQNLIIQKISQLEKDPRPPGCKKLTGREGWRIRVGNYRIVYEINDKILTIIIIDIDHCRQIYR